MRKAQNVEHKIIAASVWKGRKYGRRIKYGIALGKGVKAAVIKMGG